MSKKKHIIDVKTRRGLNAWEIERIKSNLIPYDIHEAYKKGAETIGFDISEHIKSSYILGQEIMKKYEDAGIDTLVIELGPDASIDLEDDLDWYFHFWASTAELGNPKWKWEPLPVTEFILEV